MTPEHAPIRCHDSPESLDADVLEMFLDLAARSIDARGRFRVSLSGGSTPRRLYRSIAKADLDWQRIEWFWGDERNVPPDHGDSNFRMVREALLDPAGIAMSQCHPIAVRVDEPEIAAAQYDAELRRIWGREVDLPDWDLVLLGMGDDAHTASLFPHTTALGETERWFVANWVEKFSAYRYTLTPPAINSGREIWFLIAGADKRESLARVLGDEINPSLYPAQLIRPSQYFVTRDALADAT